jgi:hypothetical protein
VAGWQRFPGQVAVELLPIDADAATQVGDGSVVIAAEQKVLLEILALIATQRLKA